MPTAYLNDRQIRPREFVKWSHAHRDFQRHAKDRAKVEALKASIQQHGILEPLILGISDRWNDVYIGDGHHRAVALRDLGVTQFPFHWYWICDYGVRMETNPFPYQLLTTER
jgi:ParB-like chromosome segregation protein Spo0J